MRRLLASVHPPGAGPGAVRQWCSWQQPVGRPPLGSPGLAWVPLSPRKCCLAGNRAPHRSLPCPEASPGSQLFGRGAAEASWALHLVRPKHCCHLGQPGLGALSGSAGHWHWHWLQAQLTWSIPGGTCQPCSAGFCLYYVVLFWVSHCPGLKVMQEEAPSVSPGGCSVGRAGAEEPRALPGLGEAHRCGLWLFNGPLF